MDPDYEFVPDVIAAEGYLEDPYPTRAFEVVVEILSPQDRFSRVLRRRRLYEKRGILQIVLIDPVDRIVWRFENGIATEGDVIATRGEAHTSAQALWGEAELQYKP